MARHQAPLLRRCATCRGWASKLELLRIVRSPTGEVRLDVGGKLPGRGAHLHKTYSCLDEALRKHYLEKALRRPLSPETAQALAALASEATIGQRIQNHPGDGGGRSP